MIMQFKIFCDGSNFVGKGSGAGVHIEQRMQPLETSYAGAVNSWLPVAQFVVPLPPESTNNEAEYHAVIAALEYLKKNVGNAIIYSDSQLVVRQISGEYRVKEPRLQILHSQITHLRGAIAADIQFIHLYREDNEIADHLARIGSMLSPLHSNG
jgi:ribonuclease HI